LDEECELGCVFMRDMQYTMKVRPRARTYPGPVALLIDGLCGSASEFMAAGLKDTKRAYLIGTRTKGEVLPGRFEKLPGGDLLLYTTDNYVCTSGRRPEGEGVGPDLEILPTREALLQGRDLALDAAVQWIRNQTVN
jgi:carboxyl-terminal processing protease